MNQGIPDTAGTGWEDDLLRRSGPLKKALVAFGQSQRFARDLSAYADKVTAAEPTCELDYINFLDRFVLEHRTRDGRTIVEQFVASQPDLPEIEIAMLLGWAKVVEGIFEVERHDGDAAVMVNLVDELTYRVRSNMGPQLLKQLVPETVAWARVVPFGNDWILSGALTPAPPEGRSEMRRAAAKLANTSPAAVFRNPDKLSLGWKLHGRLHEHFVAFFGADLAVVTGHDLADRMAGFWTYQATRVSADQSQARGALDEEQPPPVPQMSIPPDLEQAETVGIMFDKVEGLWFLPEYQLVSDVFADPALISGHRYRDAVSGYLKSQSIPPIVLRRLAEQDPERAGRVFARLLGKPRFTWQRDGEALLLRYKKRFFDRVPLPGVTPLSDWQRAFLGL